MAQMKCKVPLCYASYITIRSPKRLYNATTTVKMVGNSKRTSSPSPKWRAEVQSDYMTWPRSDRKSVRATDSVQVLEVQHQPCHTLPFFPNIFLLHRLLVSILPSLFLLRQRPLKTTHYYLINTVVFSDCMVLSFYMFSISILAVQWWLGFAKKKTHSINFSDHSVFSNWHIR